MLQPEPWDLRTNRNANARAYQARGLRRTLLEGLYTHWLLNPRNVGALTTLSGG